MLKSGEQKVEASGLNVSDFFSGETGLQLNSLFGTLEMFSKNNTIAKLVTAYNYFVSLPNLSTFLV